MVQFKIRIYNEAQKDLEDIVNYLNQFYTKTALKYYDLIIDTIGSLATMPNICAKIKDEPLRMLGYRYILVQNYIVLFLIKDVEVQIRRIIYNKRSYKGLLY